MDKRYRSQERVYEDLGDGRRRLKYAEGAPIPEDEARRQGLVEEKAEEQDSTEDKAQDAPAENKQKAKPKRKRRKSA